MSAQTRYTSADDGHFRRSANVSKEIDIGTMLRVLWRRKVAFLSIVIAITATTFFCLSQLTPRYAADALVMIEARAPKVLTVESVTPSLTTDTSSLETQSQIIQGPALMQKVIERQRLSEDPEFNPALRPRDSLIETLVDRLAPKRDGGAATDQLLENVLSRVSVAPRGKSYIIAISFAAQTPEKAATIANAIAEIYVDDQIEQKHEVAVKARGWLAGRVDEVHQRLVQTEDEIVKLQQEKNLVRGTAGTINEQQMTELSTQLIAAMTEASRADARVDRLRKAVGNPDVVDSTMEVLNSPLIQSLRQQEAQLVQKAAELLSVYGDQYPSVRNVRQELKDLRGKIRLEMDKIITAVNVDAEHARLRVATMQKALNELRAEVDVGNVAAVRVHELEREADATRSLYTNLLARSEEVAAQEGLQNSDIKIVAEASPPNAPSYPKRFLITGAAAGGSVLLAALVLLYIENRRTVLRSRQEIEQLAGLPALGLIPFAGRSWGLKRVSIPAVLGEPDAMVRQAIRSFYTTVSLNFHVRSLSKADRTQGARVILVTSSIPGEGKSVVSVLLAVQAARSGKRCLLVDCDFRRSRVARYMGVEEGAGLLQVLLNEVPVQEAVRQCEADGFDFITSGVSTYAGTDPERLRTIKDMLPDLLNQRMLRLLPDLVSRYDLIILDSPPVMVVPDALALSLMADQTIYVIRWLRTNTDLVLDGLRCLREGGANLSGFVLTQVDMKQYLKYTPNSPMVTSRIYREYY